jgi:hypothetical protein
MVEPWRQSCEDPWRPTSSPTALYQLGKQKKLYIKKVAPRESHGREHIPHSVDDTHFSELMMQTEEEVRGERIITYLTEISYIRCKIKSAK